MHSYFDLRALYHAVEWVFLIPVAGGSVYAVLCLISAALMHHRAQKTPRKRAAYTPAVTILKPVHGFEKNLRENLRSACTQDYPEFQVVFSVQEPSDPAIPLLYEIQREFGPERVAVAIESCRAGSNGKINNMIVGLRWAKHDVLVISDSDVHLDRDYLKTIVAPLADPQVGCACTLYKGACASRWFEKMELLTLNADFITSVIFAHVTGASKFCLGASAALHRATLEKIGGLEALADYLVEDYEMGRRIWVSGKQIAVIPYFVDTTVDLKTPFQWWNHQVYWDQNTRAARPVALFATILVRSIPFALLYAAMRLFDPTSLIVLAAALAIRLVTAAITLGWGFRDREGLRSLWLLPFRDVAALVSWFLAFIKRTTIWRGNKFILTRDGRLVAREARS
jgi:ceramide glucosyltransferase